MKIIVNDVLTALRLGRITIKTVVNPYDDDAEKVKACRYVKDPTGQQARSVRPWRSEVQDVHL